MKLKRRAFLQQAALSLAAIGMSQTAMAVAARRYSQALAKSAPRKLALLIGINQYPENVRDYGTFRDSALAGCLTDVRLQKELLVHRFGFKPEDIVTLTDGQATRQAIEDTFLSHLVGQAHPGDVVIFHFSGLGSRVKLLDEPDRIRNSLVPVDGVLPTEESPVVNDLMEETLGLLLRSLQTEQVVTVLDMSYAQPEESLRGSLRIRSRPNVPSGHLNDKELSLQDGLIRQIRTSREQAEQQWRSGQVPGVLLKASSDHQVAAEGQWSGFSAGLFTYALTQQLWWTTPSVTLNTEISLAGGKIEQVAGNQQQPVLEGQNSQTQSLVSHRFKPVQSMNADGVVKAVESGSSTAQIWLAGLPAPVLENYGISSVLRLVDPDRPPAESPDLPTEANDALSTLTSESGSGDGSAIEGQNTASDNSPARSSPATADPAAPRYTKLQVRSRDGLQVRAKSYGSAGGNSRPTPPQVGQFAQEYVRLLSKNINLVVALDAQLERIERVDATSALSGIPRISSVVAGEQPADFLFGKVRSPASTVAFAPGGASENGASLSIAQTDDTQSRSGYGLFYLSRSAIPNTLVESDEAVKTAVNRITPQLRTLLAAKMLRLTDNQGSSQLGVRATLEMLVPQERILMQQTTVRAPWAPPDSRLAALFATQGSVPSLPIGSRIQYRIQNYGDRPIYCALLGLDSGGNAIALYPAAFKDNHSDSASSLGKSIIEPDETLTVPQSNIATEWIVGGPVGLAETYIVCSREPLKRTADALSKAMRPMGSLRQLSVLSDPANIVQAVLADLHDASLKEDMAGLEVPSDTYALHVASWATLSFIYRVIDA